MLVIGNTLTSPAMVSFKTECPVIEEILNTEPVVKVSSVVRHISTSNKRPPVKTSAILTDEFGKEHLLERNIMGSWNVRAITDGTYKTDADASSTKVVSKESSVVITSVGSGRIVYGSEYVTAIVITGKSRSMVAHELNSTKSYNYSTMHVRPWMFESKGWDYTIMVRLLNGAIKTISSK